MNLYQWAFVLFAAVAAGGVLFTGLLLLKKPIPALLGMGHGLAGLAALAVLAAADLMGQSSTPPRAWWALAIFASGLVGGLLFFRVLFKGRATVLLAVAHGSIGALGLFVLYGAAFG